DRRENPQAHGGSAVVRRRRNPSRPQHRRDVEEQHIPNAHHSRKLIFHFARRRSAHAVASRAGISSSCSRKLCRKGSFEFSSSCHVPKNATRPSWRKITRSASFFARCVSCVTTIEVFRNFVFNFRISSPICPAIKG